MWEVYHKRLNLTVTSQDNLQAILQAEERITR